LKFARTELLEPAATKFPRLETVMMESTYGGRDNVMPLKAESDKMLGDVIKETLARNGKILMPVLGSGRAQEVLILIYKLMTEGEYLNALFILTAWYGILLQFTQHIQSI